ncbi:MAG: hypothetical protein HOO06_16490 [Bdellovibrionaceae bacterium]|jgi:hypothetical protein|nr:hypothetical protein [Pseudobdellovibrionaceae bacterium]
MSRLLPIVIIMVFSSNSWALNLIPIRGVKKMGLRINNINYPEKLKSEISSGLVTKILIQLSLLENQIILDNQIIELRIQYDLWDENYMVKGAMNKRKLETIYYKNRELLLEKMNRLKFNNIFKLTPGIKGENLQIKADILLNPIYKEKMHHIRKWVAENSISATLGGSNKTNLKAVRSSGNPMFNRIFEQLTQGENMAGVWRVTGKTKKFHLEDLKIEKQ